MGRINTDEILQLALKELKSPRHYKYKTKVAPPNGVVHKPTVCSKIAYSGKPCHKMI